MIQHSESNITRRRDFYVVQECFNMESEIKQGEKIVGCTPVYHGTRPCPRK